mmetsp:Transcript_15995/g.28792  ORF Transcript_15995/g.28792 Transcript_15995/m.28792 type:complete len:249 (+) Transcript_15995:135-881(+)
MRDRCSTRRLETGAGLLMTLLIVLLARLWHSILLSWQLCVEPLMQILARACILGHSGGSTRMVVVRLQRSGLRRWAMLPGESLRRGLWQAGAPIADAAAPSDLDLCRRPWRSAQTLPGDTGAPHRSTAGAHTQLHVQALQYREGHLTSLQTHLQDVLGCLHGGIALRGQLLLHVVAEVAPKTTSMAQLRRPGRWASGCRIASCCPDRLSLPRTRAQGQALSHGCTAMLSECQALGPSSESPRATSMKN